VSATTNQNRVAFAVIHHARAGHAGNFGDCRNPTCWRGYRLLMRLWPDIISPFGSFVVKESEVARFEIAHKVSDALPMTCWTDWATWALGMHQVQENSYNSLCSVIDDQFVRCGGCYCGKHMTPEFRAQCEAENADGAKCQ